MAVRGLGGCALFRPNEYQEVPDGGWGWLVAGAFFLVETFTYGTIKSFGIFLQDLVNEGESNSSVSWVISICVFVMTFMAPLSSVLTNRFGFQPVVMLGGVLIATGTISTAFTSSVVQMYFTTGLVAGLGYCLTFLPTVTILTQYFDRRRSLVTALASTGESFAMFALAPAFAALRDRVGWRHTLVVIGSLQASIVVCGALLRPIVIRPAPPPPPEEEEERLALNQEEAPSTKQDPCLGASETKVQTNGGATPNSGDTTPTNGDTTPTNGDSLGSEDSGVQSLKEGRKMADGCEKAAVAFGDSKAPRAADRGRGDKRTTEEEVKPAARPRAKLLDFSILREGSFICYSLFGLFATLGFFAPPLYVIELSVSRGVERERATYMLSIMAVAEVFGRLSVGWLMTRPRVRPHKLRVLLGCVVGMALVLLAFALVREFYGLAVCCAGFGFFMGAISCTHIPLLAEDQVVGLGRMASAAGVYVFIQSFAGLAGPPLGGFFVDKTGNYGSAFYCCAAGLGVGALFLGLVGPAKKWGAPCGGRRAERAGARAERPPSPGPSDEGRDSLRDPQEIAVDVEQSQRGGV